MTPAVEVQDLWKQFVLRHNRLETLKGRVLSLVDVGLRERRQVFWALRGVTLAVRHGETLGVIGPNGSGKSTLLRLIARTLEPTKGRVVVRGRVSPMLEIAVGFHPELTGQENVFLNGSLLGLSRREVGRLYPAIVEFSELEEFIDVPVKNYSSGMHARLGFSIAVHLDPEILLIDEVLSVGDQAFQEKCQDRMRQFRLQGKTIILVSHSLEAVASLCDQVCLLVHGRIAGLGEPDVIIPRYRDLVEAPQAGSDRIVGPEMAIG
jgi:ABC-type polysaccharide/polyol phosphate transport system ATPase subunit